MSSNPHKWFGKRPADSESIDPDESTPPDKRDDFKIKTLDEILQEKRRRIEKDDALDEERSETSDGNPRIVTSPPASGKRESRTSSKQGSPQDQGGSEIIYQLSPEQLSLSPMSSTSGTPKKIKRQLSHDDDPAGFHVRRGRKTTEEEEGEIVSDPSDSESKRSDKRRRHSSSKSRNTEVHVDAKEGEIVSDPSDSESKRRRHSSSKSRDTEVDAKEVEIVSDPSDSECKRSDKRRRHSSSKSRDTEVDAKEVEIVSDPSDSECKRSDKRRRHSSSKSRDTEVNTKEVEIVSDPSDSESKRSDKRRRHSSSKVADTDERPNKENMIIISDPSDCEEKRHDQQRKYSSPKDPVSEVKTTTTITIVTAKSEESSEEESEDDTETAAATKRMRKEVKGMSDVKQESIESESESDDSSSENDDDDDKMEARKESSSKIKEQQETQIKSSQNKEVVEKGNVQTNKESSSAEEESSEEESDEESDSETSEESEQEEEKKKVAQKTERVAESNKVDEFEVEDLHSELLQLKRQRPAGEKYKQKSKTERHHHDERSHIRKREQESADTRVYKERKDSDKDAKINLKYQSHVERSHGRSDSKSRPPYEKSRSGDKAEGKYKESRDKYKPSANPKDVTKEKLDRTGSREKYSEVEGDRQRKISRKDAEKRKSPDEATRTETKVQDRKDRSESRKKASSEKTSKDSRVSEDAPSLKPKKDEGPSLILTDRERRQFSNEIVDIELSEESSDEDVHVPVAPHVDSEMKQGQLSDGDQEMKREAKLPPYYPAVRGCRNVEEFQWLNRIEEGTYGVVYRAKDKRTGDIVALKKLKMEREKEGFPITSLREINTLLKAQHPNIVTVREIVVGSNMDKIYIVMDYVEHDLKVLMEHMTQGFRIGEVKTLMIQLLRAVVHLHDNWILHRDLKASNLLLSNKGILKVGDFGLAREYGSPLKNYTPIVVTLWYRAPELLLGTKEYSTPIDLWSVGCIFAELLTMKPLFPGKSEIDQINRIFKELGTPSDKIWPGPPSYSELPAVKKMTFTEYPYNNLRNKFGAYLTDKGFDLLNRFLTFDPSRRITAAEALNHEYFTESPLPVDPSMFPTWPAKSEMKKRPKKKDAEHSPQAPQGGAMFAKLADEGDSGNGSQGFRMPTSKKGSAAVVGFTLKF